MTEAQLSYDILTNPTTVQVTKGVTISLVVSNPTSNYVTISKLIFELPQSGTAATDLSNNQTNVPTTSPDGHWTIDQSGSSFTITPNNTAAATVSPASIGPQGLVFTFGDIFANAQPGTCVVNVREDTGAGLSDRKKFHISKWPVEFSLTEYRAEPASVEPGHSTVLSWKLSGKATMSLEYNGHTITSPSNPYTTEPLQTTTTITLTARSTIDGNHIEAQQQQTVEIRQPVVVQTSAQFAVIYSGQSNVLYWLTEQADYCELQSNGVILDKNAPNSTPETGFPINANNLKSTTTLALTPIKDSNRGQQQQWTIFSKTLELLRPFQSHPGWGGVALDDPGQFAYICNSITNSLDKVCPVTGKVLCSVAVGFGPRAVAITTDGKSAWVSNTFDDTVSVICLETFDKVKQTIKDIPSPAGIAMLGNNAFICSASSSAPSVITVNTQNYQKQGSPMTVKGQPFDVVITPDGQNMYIANNSGTSVDVYNLATPSVAPIVIQLSDAPTSLALMAGGSSVYAGTRIGADIYVLDTHNRDKEDHDKLLPKITSKVPAFMSPGNIASSGNGMYFAAIGSSGFYMFELTLPGALQSRLGE